ncbi:Uncharacterised protein [uncultured archaeon]|nr:Uncharacterised protein [uncultured archaeon]
MRDIVEAQKEFYRILNEKKATFRNGRFVRDRTFSEKYHIPEEVIVEAHNEGKVLDVYASRFSSIPYSAIPFLEKKIEFGTEVIPSGYTLIDLPNVPKAALYGQIKKKAPVEKDITGEIINAMQMQREGSKSESYTHAMVEKARIQKGLSPRSRIKNAILVIESADLDDSSKTEYTEQKQDAEEGVRIAKEILNGIYHGRWTLTLKQEEPGLSKEQLEKFMGLYADGSEVEAYSKLVDAASEKLTKIDRCREILEMYELIVKVPPEKRTPGELPAGYSVKKELIDAITHTSLGSLPNEWIEVK